jgi:hypothetical protein
MLDPLPSLALAIACALHTHLQCRDANTSQGRHLFVTLFFDVFQEKGFSQQRVQLAEHTLHELFVFTWPRRRGGWGVQQDRFFANEHFLPVGAPSRDASALIHQYPV